MRRLRKGLLALALVLAATPALAEPVAIVNARLFTMGPAGEVSNGAVVIDGGRILAAGAGVAPPRGARVIDAAGAIVTPGLIAGSTALGAVEVNTVRGTVDNRVGGKKLSAAFDVRYGLNPRSTLIPVARLGGVTRAVVMPDYGAPDEDGGGLFAGQAALIALDGSPDLKVAPGLAMVLDLGEDGAARAGGARGAEFVALRAAFDEVRLYARRRADYERGELRELSLPREDLEALIPVLEGRRRLIVGASREADIRQALKLARDYGLKIVLSGAEEGWLLADEIAAAGAPVLLNPTSNLPTRFETLAASFRNAARLRQAGVEIAILGSDGTHRVREMRYNAGIAVARGLPYADALRALTLGPARIFGVADRLGSLEPGKAADLVIWSGDPLEPASQPVAVFIAGVEQPLTSRPLLLRDRYSPGAALARPE
ncbi:MAG: amidohydrolase family protein [Phenylobacterium sp.]|uniref:amidohydrolase family protein n=1 Tax=Phenylobacterium sp. TaxID=1871053 RepID=UPI0039189021